MVGTFDNSGTVALCLIAKDEEDIVEWITYHARLGVSKFYVFDNGSKPPLQRVLQPLGDLVEYEYTYGDDRWLHKFVNQYITNWRDEHINKQTFVYDKCMERFGHRHSWMGFLDTDEFVVVKKKPGEENITLTIPGILQEFLPFGGLRLAWIMFGSSGRIKRPLHGVLGHSGNYTKCCKFCSHLIMLKAFVQPRYATKSAIHDFLYKPPYYSVLPNNHSTDYDPHKAYDRIWINHYSIKSAEDYQMKMKRGAGNDVHRGIEYFRGIDNATRDLCPLLFMPEV